MLFKLFLIGYLVLTNVYANTQDVELKISHTDAHATSHQEEKIPLLIVLHGTSSLLEPLTELIRKDLEQTHQIHVKIMHGVQPTNTEDVAQHFRTGYSFVTYLGMEERDNEVRSRLYNTLDVAMIQGKKWHKRENLSVWAHYIAHALWKEIIGTESSFLSSIVYITKEYNRAKQVQSSLVITDWDGSSPRTILTRKTHLLAPCWLPAEQVENSMIIFSEFAATNVRLMKVMPTELAVPKIVFNRSGTTVGVSASSPDNIVYCRSGVIWRYTYDSLLHRSMHVPLIREQDPCACPIAVRNGDVIYCSQGSIKRWHTEQGTTEVITRQGFCTSPAFHEDRNILIFSRRVKGTFQLVCKDFSTGIERLLTHDSGNKIDPTISPCGFFVAYTLEKGKRSSICILNLSTDVSREISNPSDFCMCPAWSMRQYN